MQATITAPGYIAPAAEVLPGGADLGENSGPDTDTAAPLFTGQMNRGLTPLGRSRAGNRKPMNLRCGGPGPHCRRIRMTARQDRLPHRSRMVPALLADREDFQRTSPPAFHSRRVPGHGPFVLSGLYGKTAWFPEIRRFSFLLLPGCCVPQRSAQKS